jgi:hypothetical protein
VITDKEGHGLAKKVTAGGAADIVIRERFESYPKRLLDAIEFSIIRGELLREIKEKNAGEVKHHKQILHWMMGGYSIEVEADTIEETIKSAENMKNIA